MRPVVYPQRAPQVSYECFQGEEEVLLLDLQANRYYTLNETAAAFWMLADGRRSWAEITAALQEGYEVTAEELTEALARLREELMEAGLLTEHESPVEAEEDSEPQ